MNSAEVREKARVTKQQAEAAEAAVRRMEKACTHDFSPVEYDPIIREGYTTSGDAPGTMGIDWQGPVSVPTTRIDRWVRHCPLCGKTEYTLNTKDTVVKTPVF